MQNSFADFKFLKVLQRGVGKQRDTKRSTNLP